jgi:hypothetical protein
MRDEQESLQRRLDELRAENERLRSEVAALPPKKRWDRPWLIVLVCLLVTPLAWSGGCYAGSKRPAAMTP